MYIICSSLKECRPCGYNIRSMLMLYGGSTVDLSQALASLEYFQAERFQFLFICLLDALNFCFLTSTVIFRERQQFSVLIFCQKQEFHQLLQIPPKWAPYHNRHNPVIFSLLYAQSNLVAQIQSVEFDFPLFFQLLF